MQLFTKIKQQVWRYLLRQTYLQSDRSISFKLNVLSALSKYNSLE